MLQLTLRKASKLVNKVDEAIHEAIAEVGRTSHTDVFIHDKLSSIGQQMDENAAKWRESFLAVIQLQGMREILRATIGRANAENGVNDLVTGLRMTEAKLGFVTGVRRSVGTVPRISQEELNIRLEAYRKKGESARVEVSSWHRSQQEDSNVRTFGTLEEKDLEQLQIEEKALKQKIEAIVDQLERINALIQIDIFDALEADLRKFELIT